MFLHKESDNITQFLVSLAFTDSWCKHSLLYYSWILRNSKTSTIWITSFAVMLASLDRTGNGVYLYSWTWEKTVQGTLYKQSFWEYLSYWKHTVMRILQMDSWCIHWSPHWVGFCLPPQGFSCSLLPTNIVSPSALSAPVKTCTMLLSAELHVFTS